MTNIMQIFRGLILLLSRLTIFHALPLNPDLSFTRYLLPESFFKDLRFSDRR